MELDRERVRGPGLLLLLVSPGDVFEPEAEFFRERFRVSGLTLLLASPGDIFELERGDELRDRGVPGVLLFRIIFGDESFPRILISDSLKLASDVERVIFGEYAPEELSSQPDVDRGTLNFAEELSAIVRGDNVRPGDTLLFRPGLF